MGSVRVEYALAVALAIIIVAAAVLAAWRPCEAPLAGYWATPAGDLFEIRRARGGGFAVATASGLLGADPARAYPVAKKGCRAFEARFPAGALRGRASLDRRLILWGGGAPAWRRQGVP